MQSEKIRQQVLTLRDKIKHLEKSLEDYRKFGGSEYNISKLLGLAATFFQNQGTPNESLNKYPDV